MMKQKCLFSTLILAFPTNRKNEIDYICSFDTKDYKVKALAEVKKLDVKKVCHKGGETFGMLCTFGDYRK